MADTAGGGNLGRRYELVRQLGAGGMGVVHEALDRERGVKVALKTVQRGTPEAVARFKREFRALSDIVHPNLVTLYELFAEDDEVFFTMELVDGPTFTSWVRPATDAPEIETATVEHGETVATVRLAGSAGSPVRARPRKDQLLGGQVDIPRLRDALRQLAEGVSALHAVGMLHRDLKPSNVLVGTDARVVVLDFGLVADIAMESLLRFDERPLEGTVAFMSPEQSARGPLSPASDWYSVGVMLYLSLTGRLPFLGERDDVLMDKQRFEPPPPHEVAPAIPEDLSALCVELLRRDPRRRPRGEELLRRLGSAPGRAMLLRTLASTPESLVGRERQLESLRDAQRATSRGRSVVARVHGLSGMGKSSLTRVFLDGLGDQVLVLHGRCYERESVPFKAVDSLVDALARYLGALPPLEVEGLMPRDAPSLARLFPVLRQIEAFTSPRRRILVTPDPQELRRRAFAAMRELLARVADRTVLVLAIDDVQWGDVDSAALLASILRPPDPPPLMLLVAYRSEDVESSEFLGELERQLESLDVEIVDVPVGPLSEEDASELARLHCADLSDRSDAAARIAHEAQGNPFFVEELARHLRERAGAANVSLEEVLRDRLLRVPSPADHLLSILAVAGRPTPQDVALRAANVNDPSALAILRAGSFMRVRTVGGVHHLEAFHDRIREVAVSLLTAEELRAHHHRLALVYEAVPHAEPETLAIHFAGAGDRERGARYALRAARRASEALAFDRAARLLRMVLKLDPASPRAVLVELGDALAHAGRGGEAADAYLRAVEGAAASEVLDLRCRAAGQLLYSGHIDRGLEILGEISATMGMKLAPTARRAVASLLFKRAYLAMRGLGFRERDERDIPASTLTRVDVAFAVAEGLGMTDTTRAAEFQGRHLLLALRAGEPRRVARALAAEAVFTSLRGTRAGDKPARILATLDQMAERLDEPAIRGLAIGAAGLVAFNSGRWSESYEQCARAEQIFRDHCVGYRWELATSHLFKSFNMALTGRIREMIAGFPAMVEEAYERGDLYAATSLRACLGFYVPLAADDVERAYRELDDAIGRWTPRGFHLQHANALHSGICIDLYAGDGRRGLERCAAVWPALRRSHLLLGQILRVILLSARARAQVSAALQAPAPELLRQAERTARSLSRERAEYATALAEVILAAVAHQRGDDARALTLLEAGGQRFTACDLHLSAGCARRVRGALLGGDEGAAIVREVDELFASQGLRNPARVARIFASGFRD